MEQLEYTLPVGIKNGTAILENNLAVSCLVKYHKSQQLYSLVFTKWNDMKTYTHTKICIWMFTAALLIMACGRQLLGWSPVIRGIHAFISSAPLNLGWAHWFASNKIQQKQYGITARIRL